MNKLTTHLLGNQKQRHKAAVQQPFMVYACFAELPLSIFCKRTEGKDGLGTATPILRRARLEEKVREAPHPECMLRCHMLHRAWQMLMPFWKAILQKSQVRQGAGDLANLRQKCGSCRDVPGADAVVRHSHCAVDN